MKNNNFPSDTELLKALDSGSLEQVKRKFKDYYENFSERDDRFLLEEQLTIVSTKTLHEIFKTKYGADAIALYMFYYYTAKWQRTNQPKATTSFCLKGLKWGESRFKRAKTILKKNDLIEDVFAKDEQGKIIGWYIKIKYLWRDETIQKIKTTPPKKPPTGFQETNTLSENKLKSLKCNKTSQKYSSLKDIQKKDLVEISDKYKVNLGFVTLQFEKLKNYCEAKGRRYKNYKSALRNFVLGDMQRQVERRQDDKYHPVDARNIK